MSWLPMPQKRTFPEKGQSPSTLARLLSKIFGASTALAPRKLWEHSLCSRLVAEHYRWKLKLRNYWLSFGPWHNPEKLQVFKKRAADADLSNVQLERACRCGACRIVVQHGGPLFTAMCHCSVCRAHNQTEGPNAPMAFAAVRLSACELHVCRDDGADRRTDEPPPDADEDLRFHPFAWFQTSTTFRRGRCSLCDTPLVMHFEHVEPNTCWIVNARAILPGVDGSSTPAHEYHDGTYDCDIFWASRHTAVPPGGHRTSSKDPLVTYATRSVAEKVGTTTDGTYPPPRGRVLSDDWPDGDYPNDVGRL